MPEDTVNWKTALQTAMFPSYISVATVGMEVFLMLPPTGSGLDPEIRANPMRSI